MERIGALPDRLRLLGLPGEDRARQVLSSAANLLRGDAGNAAAILGGAECAIPAEIVWARSVVDALGNGAEADVHRARILLDSARELEALFSGSTAELLSATDRETVQQVLDSERFFERLPDLRGVVRSLSDAAGRTYRRERAEYAKAIKSALAVLEADPDWSTLVDENREEIASRLQVAVSDAPDADNPVRSLQTLLVRRSMLPTLLEELRKEIQKRKPTQRPSLLQGGAEPEEEVVTPNAVIEPALITTAEELDGWLAALRSRLAAVLKAHKRIRIKGRG